MRLTPNPKNQVNWYAISICIAFLQKKFYAYVFFNFHLELMTYHTTRYIVLNTSVDVQYDLLLKYDLLEIKVWPTYKNIEYPSGKYHLMK